jgi:ubiquinone/menaquinone biosynthesis C-methylase UbiE
MEKPSASPLDTAALTARLNALYASHVASPTHRTIFRDVYGAEYPEEAVPLSYVTMTLLRRIARAVAVGAGATIIDLGCGRGGPGLWVARETGASLVGVDLSDVAVEQAAQRAKDFNVEGRARFEVSDLTALRFAEGTFDGAMSVDVLWVVADKRAALREVARILKPGARFVFTNWDRDRSQPSMPPSLADYRPLLQETGFTVETYDEVPEDEQKRRAIYERYLASQEALAREMGRENAQVLEFEARRELGLLDGTDYFQHTRRTFVVARKR